MLVETKVDAKSSRSATKFGARALDLSALAIWSWAGRAAGGRKKICTDLRSGLKK